MASRTQQQRREATIAKLLDATIHCLVTHGYRDTSIGRICEQAGVSHGGLFRHFSTRTALVAAATDEIGLRHMSEIKAILENTPDTTDTVETLVHFFRAATRTGMSAAWREVIVASRTDDDLRDAVTPAVQRLEDAAIDMAGQIPGAPKDKRKFGTLVLSLMHMFDSEACTAVIFETEDIEDIRHKWAVETLRSALIV